MSLPRYGNYKESGNHWLGDVPDRWQVMRVKHALDRVGSGGTPDTSNPMLWSDEGTAWVAIGDMSSRDLIHATEKSLSPQGIESKALPVWPPGTLLFSMYASLGHVAELAIPAATNQAILALLPKQKVCQGFLKRWFECIRPNLRQEASSNTQDNLNAEKVRNLPFLLPTFIEQVAISKFLDRETAKIDALIVEQEKLLTLLAEKRQATISHAITRGLDPNVPMKDSDVQWLGRVPKHWTVMPIRLAAKLESGHTPSRSKSEYWENCTVPWFTLADVWQIRDGDADYVEETKELVSELGLANSSARLLPKGTVILSRTASVGFSAIMGVAMATTQDFANWICGPRLLPEYLLHTLRSMTGEFRRLMMGSTHNTIYMPDIQSLRFVLPPLEEQREIIQHVRSAIVGFDKLIEQSKRAIVLLRERRSALVAAAVTGKIDVRGNRRVNDMGQPKRRSFNTIDRHRVD